VRAVYVDTSVLGRVLLNEPDRPAIQAALEDVDELVSSRLLWIELGRLARRRDAECAARGEPREFGVLAQELLQGIASIPLEDDLLDPDDMLGEAERIAPYSVATLDAIHLATAAWLARHDLLKTIMTYDKRLAEGASERGLTVLAPE
jgi:predicted nucleic acid-binding protein